MASKILATFEAGVEPTISLASIGNGAGRISAVVDNSTLRAPLAKVAVKAKTGTSPTADSQFRIFLVEQTGDATNNVKAGGGALGDVDAAVSAEPYNSRMIGSILVTGTSNVEYSEVFTVEHPGKKFSIVVWNATGAAMHATPPTPSVQVVLVTPEAQ